MDAGAEANTSHAVECPHCKKPFEATLIAGGVERHRGFKCPHCKLFIPESRAEDGPLTLARD